MNEVSPPKTLLIVAAEASSELYAARIIEECKKRNLPIEFFGIGSQRMKSLGFELVEQSEKMAVVGLWEVISHWEVIKNAFNKILLKAREKKPDLALLLDYPDFNLRLAKRLKVLHIPVFYYISPQVWAWRTGRVSLIKKIISKMLVLFPFEIDFYKSHGVDVSFVGHPLLDELPSSLLSKEKRSEKRTQMGVKDSEFLTGLLPGSRESELKYNFVSQLRAAEIISREAPETKFMILIAPSLETEFVKTYIPADLKLNYVLIKDEPLKMIQLCDACIVASGTATLVTALAEVPMVIMYKMNMVTAGLARKLVKGKFFGMPNLVMDEKIIPELFQEEAEPPFLAAEILKYIRNKEYLESTKLKLANVKKRLGSQGATVRVVDEIQKFLKL